MVKLNKNIGIKDTNLTLENIANIINNLGQIITGNISASTTIANNGEGQIGSITLNAGSYVIVGILNVFPANGSKWILLREVNNIIAMQNLDNIEAGNVVGLVSLTSQSTVYLDALNYTGSTITYVPHWSDKIFAIKIK